MMGLGMATLCSAAEPQDTVVTVPETGYLAIKPSRNFTTSQPGVIVASLFGSKNSGLSFTKYRLDTVVVSSSTNSSSGLFLVAQPGTYTLTLTDAEVTGRINSTTVSWQQEPGQVYKKGRFLYKFVNEPGHIGFERDARYAADNYQYCDMAEGEHIYLPLAENNLKKAAELLETTVDQLDFIPFQGPWKNVPSPQEAAGIRDVSVGERPSFTDRVYDLQGRPVHHPVKGLYVIGGKKSVVR